MAATVKTVQGLALASVKTVDGLAIASVKTILGQNSQASASYTLVFDSVTAGNNLATFGDATSSYYAALGNYNDSTSRNVGKISVRLTKLVGDISGKTFTVRIWSMTGSALNAQLATSAGVTGDNSWNNTVVEFLITYTMASSTVYAVTIDAGGTDALNNATSYFNSTGAAPIAWPAHYNLYRSDQLQQADFSGFNLEAKLYTSP